MIAGKKSGFAFWAVVAVFGVLLYPISFGPACWFTARIATPEPVGMVLARFYFPLLRMSANGPAWIRVPLTWWKELGKPPPTMPMPVSIRMRISVLSNRTRPVVAGAPMWRSHNQRHHCNVTVVTGDNA
jgi:hypothetical protein